MKDGVLNLENETVEYLSSRHIVCRYFISMYYLNKLSHSINNNYYRKLEIFREI